MKLKSYVEALLLQTTTPRDVLQLLHNSPRLIVMRGNHHKSMCDPSVIPRETRELLLAEIFLAFLVSNRFSVVLVNPAKTCFCRDQRCHWAALDDIHIARLVEVLSALRSCGLLKHSTGSFNVILVLKRLLASPHRLTCGAIHDLLSTAGGDILSRPRHAAKQSHSAVLRVSCALFRQFASVTAPRYSLACASSSVFSWVDLLMRFKFWRFLLFVACYTLDNYAFLNSHAGYALHHCPRPVTTDIAHQRSFRICTTALYRPLRAFGMSLVPPRSPHPQSD